MIGHVEDIGVRLGISQSKEGEMRNESRSRVANPFRYGSAFKSKSGSTGPEDALGLLRAQAPRNEAAPITTMKIQRNCPA